MSTPLPINAPTVKWVLTADNDYLFKPGVRALADLLTKLIASCHAQTGETAKTIHLLAQDLELPASDIITAQTALAALTDQVEEAALVVIQAVAGRPLAYVKPPAGDAVTATIIPGSPVPKP